MDVLSYFPKVSGTVGVILLGVGAFLVLGNFFEVSWIEDLGAYIAGGLILTTGVLGLIRRGKRGKGR